MNYIVHYSNTLASDKKWLTRNKYSKLSLKVLGYLVKPNIPIDDIKVSQALKVSLTAYKDAKRELVYAGLLEVHKINSNTIVLALGDKAIEKYHSKYRGNIEARLITKTIESLDITYTEEDNEDEVTLDYTPTNIQELAKKIPLPSSIETSIKVL